MLCGCQPAPPPQLTLDSIEPATATFGQPIDAELHGAGFAAPGHVNLDDHGGLAIDRGFRVTIGNLELAGDSVRLRRTNAIDVSIPGSLGLGPHDVSVITPSGETATLYDGFTVGPLAPRADASVLPQLRDAGIVVLSSRDAGPDAPAPAIADASTDAQSPNDAFACSQSVDADTLAFYRFEGNLLDDTGNHDARAVGTARFAAGEVACGQAVAFDGSYYVRIDDDADWTLPVGSIDFWYRATAHPTGDPAGLVSRDEDGETGPGQITIYHAGESTGRLLVRMQDPSELYACSDAPLPLGEWVHVGLNVGPPRVELFVNGVLQTATDTLPFYFDQVPCGGVGAHSLGNNQNPWVVGAAADISGPGQATPVRPPLSDGAINELRISRVRRDFGS